MKNLFFCLVFILTNAVMAQAADLGTTHLQLQKWTTTYAGEGEVDGLPVDAILQETQLTAQIPAAMASVGDDAIVPSLMPVIKKAYRLNLIVSRSPLVQMTYTVEPRHVSIDGTERFAYVSDLAPNNNIQFVITTEANGSLHVTYARKVADGSQVNGEFALSPVPHILGK